MDRFSTFSTTFVFFVSVCFIVQSEAINQSDFPAHYRLKQRLLHNYEPALRPIKDPKRLMNISVMASLYQIIDLDQARNNLKATLGLDLKWVDELMHWNQSDYGGLEETFLPAEKMWTPDFSLWYNVLRERVVNNDDLDVRIDYTGRVNYYMSLSVNTLCPLNVKNFPFDKQVCNITFGSFIMMDDSLVFHVRHPPNSSGGVDLSNFYDNQEWELEEVRFKSSLLSKQESNRSYSRLIIEINLERQAFFYIFNTVLPAAVITFVALVGFHLPGSSMPTREAKVPLGVTTLLALCFLLIGISNAMPKFSESAKPGQRGSFSGVPLIAIYYACLLLLISMSSIFTTLFAYADRRIRYNNDIPCFMRMLAKLMNPSLLVRANQNKRPVDVVVRQQNFKRKGSPSNETVELRTLLTEPTAPALQNDINYENLNHNRFSDPGDPGENDATKLLETISNNIKQLVNIGDSTREDIAYLRKVQSINAEWAHLFNRVNLISFIFFTSLLVLFLVMFFHPEFWYYD